MSDPSDFVELSALFSVCGGFAQTFLGRSMRIDVVATSGELQEGDSEALCETASEPDSSLLSFCSCLLLLCIGLVMEIRCLGSFFFSVIFIVMNQAFRRRAI